MQDTPAKIKDLASSFKLIQKSFDISSKKKKIAELEYAASDSGLWQDAERARAITRELGDLKKDVSLIEKLESEIGTLESLVKEGEADNLEGDVSRVEKELQKIKLKSFLADTYDNKNAILAIHAGQGGVEAMDWAGMLMRMYLRYAERMGWETQTFDISEGEEAGIKSVSIRVQGTFSYGYLKGESGTHRLVRQSPFNADNLRQTSFALVEVLPELTAIDLPDIKIKDDEIEWQFFRASSQGGQNVQKVSTAVRLTHKPTGIVVTAQTERYQEQNRKLALSLLRAKLWLREKEAAREEKKSIKGDYRPASWGNQIRSYVLHPYKMVKDLRTGIETSDATSVLDGDISDFIEAQLAQKVV